MTFLVLHSVTRQPVSEHGTKKAATATADEMTQAHREIDARHEGQEVAFVVEKAPEPPLPILVDGDAA